VNLLIISNIGFRLSLVSQTVMRSKLGYHDTSSPSFSQLKLSSPVKYFLTAFASTIDGTSVKWRETDLVVKARWPGSGRVPETDFLEEACAETEKTKDKRAIKHLPQMLHARDVPSS